MIILSIIEKIILNRVRKGGLFMRSDIQSFLDDLQIMPVYNSKRLADVLAQLALLETHRLFIVKRPIYLYGGVLWLKRRFARRKTPR